MSSKKTSTGDPGALEPKPGGAPLERSQGAPIPDQPAPLPEAPGPGVPIEPDPLLSWLREPHSLTPGAPTDRPRVLANAQFRPGMGPGLDAEQEGDRRDNPPAMPSDEDLERARKRAKPAKK